MIAKSQNTCTKATCYNVEYSWIGYNRSLFVSEQTKNLAHDYKYKNRVVILWIVIWRKIQNSAEVLMENALLLCYKTLETLLLSSSILEIGSSPTSSENRELTGQMRRCHFCHWSNFCVFLKSKSISLVLFNQEIALSPFVGKEMIISWAQLDLAELVSGLFTNESAIL